MEIGDIVNVRKVEGDCWKGKVTDVLHEWIHPLKTGEVLRQQYTSPIVIVNGVGGVGHAVFHVKDLHLKDGEYYE